MNLGLADPFGMVQSKEKVYGPGFWFPVKGVSSLLHFYRTGLFIVSSFERTDYFHYFYMICLNCSFCVQ